MRPSEIPVCRAVIPASLGGEARLFLDHRPERCQPHEFADPDREARIAALAARVAAGECLFEDGPVPADAGAARRGKGRRGKGRRGKGRRSRCRGDRFKFRVRLPVSPAGEKETKVVRFGDVGCVNCSACGVLLLGESWAWVKAAAVRAATRDRLPAVVAGRVAGRPVCEECRG